MREHCATPHRSYFMLLRRAIRHAHPLASRGGCCKSNEVLFVRYAGIRGFTLPGAGTTSSEHTSLKRSRGFRSVALLSPAQKPQLAEDATTTAPCTAEEHVLVPLEASNEASPRPEELLLRAPHISDAPCTPEQAAALTASLLDHLKYLDPPALRVRLLNILNSDGNLGVSGVKVLMHQTTGSACSDAEAMGVVRCLAQGSDFTKEKRATASGTDGKDIGELKRLAEVTAYTASPAKTVATYAQVQAAVDAEATVVDARVLPVFATLTLSFTAQGAQFPVIPQLVRSLDLTAADLGLITGATAFGRLLANVPAASLAQRIGRRPLIVAGPCISALGMLGLASADSFLHLTLANGCVGIGSATALAGAGLYLADLSTPRNRAQTNAPVFQSALMGFAIGPLIGGGLASVVGLSWPFVGCSAALVASSAAAASLLPETMHGARLRQQQMQSQFHPQPPPEPSQQSSSSLSSSAQRLESQPEHFKSELTSPAPQPSTTTTSTFQLATQLAQRPALQGLGPVVFMNGFGQGAMPVTMVLFGLENMGMDGSAIGAMLAANVLMMVLVSRPATILSDRVSSRKSLVLPALLASAVATALQPLSGSPWEFAGLVACASLAQAVSMPSLAPLLLDACDQDHERPTALALRQTTSDVGTLIGAASMGVVAAHGGIAAALTTVAALQGGAALLFGARVPGESSPRGWRNKDD